MLNKSIANQLIFAIIVIAILFASVFLTWQMSHIPLASSPIDDYCSVEISGLPLPVRYDAMQYDFYDETTKGTVFAECIWPEFGQAHTIQTQNVIINWIIYLALILAIVNLLRKRKKISLAMIIIIGIISILIMVTLSIINDYTKGGDIINQYKSEGWTVVSATYNDINITAPWTLYVQTIETVTFVKPNEITKLDNEYLTAKLFIIVLDYQYTGEMSFFTSNNIYDCDNNKSGFIGDFASEDINYETLIWYEYYEDVAGYETGYEIIQRICDYKK